MRGHRVGPAFAGLLVAAAAQGAVAREKLAIAPFRVAEGMPSKIGEQIVWQVKEALDGHPAVVAAYDVQSPEKSNPVWTLRGSCYDPASAVPAPKCLEEFGKQVGVENVLFGDLVQGANQRYEVTVRVLSMRTHGVEIANASAAVLLAVDWSDAEVALKKPISEVLKLPVPVAALPAPAPPPPPPPGKGLRYAAFGAGAAGVLSLAMGVYFGASAGSLGDDLRGRHQRQGRFLDADQADLTTVRSQETLANVMFGVGAALAVTSGALFYVTAGPAPAAGMRLSF